MNELVKVEVKSIGNDEVNAVDARELHEFLESKQDYSDWIKNRIKKYEFAQGIDFTTFHKSMEKGMKPRKEYFVSIDMAKELSMVERNDKGKEARGYFIECERKLKSIVPSLPDFTNPVIAARAWADEVEAKEKLQIENKKQTEELEYQKPRVEFANQISKTEDCVDFIVLAKILSNDNFVIGRNNLMKFLKKRHILLSSNLPAQTYIDRKWFIVKESTYEKNSKTYINYKTTTTIKGQIKIQKMLKEEFNY